MASVSRRCSLLFGPVRASRTACILAWWLTDWRRRLPQLAQHAHQQLGPHLARVSLLRPLLDPPVPLLPRESGATRPSRPYTDSLSQIHPSRLRPLFLAKGIILPIVAIGTMAWAIHEAGDQASEVLTAKSSVTGVQGYLAFGGAVTACMGTWSTMACNIGDFSRYSKKPASAATQLLLVPMLWVITSLFGAIASNCTLAVYGEILWQPFDLIDKWQGTHVGRFFAFVCAFAWCIGNIGTNITANSISSANDLCALFPRWVTIFRGQMVAITVGVFAFAPWKVLASASNLISFMSSYSIVLAPIASLLSADYYLVKGSKIDVPAMYDPKGIYRYWYGINWRAAVALFVAIAPNLPGKGSAAPLWGAFS